MEKIFTYFHPCSHGQNFYFISYIIPTRAVWDLLPEPEGEGNYINPMLPKGVWYNYLKAYYGNTSALL